jgi:hypothetical protein
MLGAVKIKQYNVHLALKRLPTQKLTYYGVDTGLMHIQKVPTQEFLRRFCMISRVVSLTSCS